MVKRKSGTNVKKPLKMLLAATLVFGGFAGIGERQADAEAGPGNPSPGGVDPAHLKLWLRADAGVQVENGEFKNWADQTGINIFEDLGTNSTAVHAGEANFNPAVVFPGQLSSVLRPTEDSGVYATNEAFAAVRKKGAGGTVAGPYFSTASNPAIRSLFRGTPTGETGTQFSDAGSRVGSAINGGPLDPAGNFNLFGVSAAAGLGWNNGRAGAAPKASFAPHPTPVAIGSYVSSIPNNLGEPLNGSVGELIIFDSELTQPQRKQVQSYLALKYGITLTADNGDPTDYISSDGASKVWAAADNEEFGSRITGIGRDDYGSLLQKQSKSQGADSLVTLALGSAIAEFNAANPVSIPQDRSFYTFSDNGLGGGYDLSVGYTDAQGTSVLKRMERMHKVEATANWSHQNITLKPDIAQRAAAEPEQYYLVIGGSEDLSEPRLIPLDGDGRVTLNSADLPDGSFFTFAHVDKTDLSALSGEIDTAVANGALKEENYTSESWTELQNARDAAAAALSNPNASQAQIDAALHNLSDAYEALKLAEVGFEKAVLEKTPLGSRIVVTLDRPVTFGGDAPAGFTVTVGGQNVPVENLTIAVDPGDATKVIVTLPEELDLSGIDEAGIAYDGAAGSLKGTNGRPVASFEETAQSGLGASLQITRPGSGASVPGTNLSFEGTVESGSDVTVELLDAQGRPLPEGSGTARVDAGGSWTFTPVGDLPPGVYTLKVTAAKDGQTATRTRIFTVAADKAALKNRADRIDAENLNPSRYTSSSWTALETARAEARSVLNDPKATQAQVDAALDKLNTARANLTPITNNPPTQPEPGNPGISNPPAAVTPQPNGPTTQIIAVDVASGAEDLRDITKVELQRTTDTDGTLSDRVTFTPAKAREAIDKALAKNDPVARILIPDEADAVSRVNVDVPLETVNLLKANKMDLEIHNPNGLVVLPASSLEGWDSSFYFRLVPVKNAQERESVEQRAQTERVVRELSGSKAAEVVSRPMTIETNLSSRPVTLVLPLDGAKLPADAQARETFLQNLGVYIEHSDGTKEVVRGAVETIDSPAAAANKLGLRFGISKFSTFTIVSLDAEQGSHKAYLQGYTDGTLRPDRSVTRAEMAAMLVRLGELGALSPASFADVAKNHWASDEIRQVSEAGWMQGYTGGTFKPEGAITREEMATIAFNYLRLSESDASGLFPDVPAAGWSAGAIAAVQAQGVMSGYPDGTFRPQGQLTRAEAVTILNRLFERGPLHGSPAASWKDVPAGHWAYGDLLEAATGHVYTDRSGGGEDWISGN
ncbi:S-layer homology domain-containing protein [Saccharibacillus sp. CPCC 101409]|uniref:S-layer homology domain-containing protein n=1 Tax=Saccharibacillus sp. CPCC 101409 TaxID=3058041 RepID=UPI0026711ECD|nr:S-layer homology domain-containing protein [Saccharibacillus sp. CPCC 101409]MDO3410021.1 S-layer homology domain-containing protein [Saccharibacillus sp. CPCC 101409]